MLVGDDFGEFEDWQEHGNDYAAYNYAQKTYYQRLYKTGEAAYSGIYLVFVKISYLGQHLFQLACLLPYLDHPDNHRRKSAAFGQGVSYIFPFFYSGAHRVHCLFYYSVACGFSDYFQRNNGYSDRVLMWALAKKNGCFRGG